MSSEFLTGVNLKLERAEQLRAELRAEIDDFRARDSIRIEIEQDPDIKFGVFRAVPVARALRLSGAILAMAAPNRKAAVETNPLGPG